jgi:adenylosuccinate synthase
MDKEVYAAIKDIQPLQELSLNPIKFYNASTQEEVLNPLIDKHQIIIVAGSFFGDEGKGKTVHAIAANQDVEIVARVNSGANAGHTVCFNNKKFIFHLVPSSIVEPSVKSIIGPECLMEPLDFMADEIQPLVDNNIDYKERLIVGNVHLVTPYHRLLDLLTNPNNTSTLRGMGPASASKVSRRGLRINDVFNSKEEQREKLKLDIGNFMAWLNCSEKSEKELIEFCEGMNKDIKRVPNHVIQFLKAENKIEFLIELYQEHIVDNPNFPKIEDCALLLRKTLKEGKKVIIEGPQSYYLSNGSEQYWRNGASPDTSAYGILAATRINLKEYLPLILNIHKAPGSSRVGRGANPFGFVPQDYYSKKGIRTLNDLDKGACANFDKIQAQYFESIQENGILNPTQYVDESGEYQINEAMAIASVKKHGEKGATTSKPRGIGCFDCVAHHLVNQVQGPNLSISAVDRGDDYDYVGIVIAYIYYNKDGEIISSNGKSYKNGDLIRPGDPLPCSDVLYYCRPIIKKIKGWKGEPIAAGIRDPNAPLPQGVQDLIANIEHFTGAKIFSIGNGPESDNIIYIKEHNNN